MRSLLISLVLLAAACAPGAAQETGPARALDVTHTQNARVVPAFDVFEVTFQHDGAYADPFLDVTIEVTFASPSGRQVQVGGFHYGSSESPDIHVETERTERGERRHAEYRFARQNLWKARLAPWEAGEWTYRYAFSDARGGRATASGAFTCVTGRRPSAGFVRRNPANPFRWVFEDGSPYFPVGLQDCWGDGSGTGSALAAAALDGPFRTDRTDLVELPEGPLYVRGPSMDPQNGDVYFRRYGRAGFNLFRFSQSNCSFDLYRDLDHYLVQEGVMTDELLRQARKYGFRVMYGLFGYQKVFNDQPGDEAAMAKVKRFVKYSVDRWGAYVDFWQFLNEQNAADEWYAQMAPYLRSVDPYGHPIMTSWERPQLAGIEVNTPHWYECEDERQSDGITASRAREWRQHGKPVIVGEQGNYVNREGPRAPGVGGVWDAGSARRMRLRLWAALFNEIALVFWNTSYARDGHYMNIWLGPQERQYVRALQDFARRLDADVKMVPVEVSEAHQVRAYGLASARRVGAYLHHFADHAKPLQGLAVTLDVPVEAIGYWYSPADAAVLGSFLAPAGRQTFAAPPFEVDLALLITPDGPPDVDGDDSPNHLDADDDNDGVPDGSDAFPLEPEEWADADGDLIGGNLDADDDGDGRGDDHNGNGLPDCEEMDLDGDGVPRAKAVPWDAFPDDPGEWRDTDGDGLGDNADPDDDGDGWPDLEERQAGTGPLDRLSFPVG